MYICSGSFKDMIEGEESSYSAAESIPFFLKKKKHTYVHQIFWICNDNNNNYKWSINTTTWTPNYKQQTL